jgi:hypothetical protein
MLWLQVRNPPGECAVIKADMSADDEADAARIFGAQFVSSIKAEMAVKDTELLAANPMAVISKAPYEIEKQRDTKPDNGKEEKIEKPDGKEKR